MKKDIIAFEQNEMLIVANALSRHNNEHNISFSKEMKKFIKEVQHNSKPNKNLSFKRASLLSVNIFLFYFNNSILIEPVVENFIKRINSEVDDSVAVSLINAATEAKKILKECKKRRFLKSELYFCDGSTLERFKKIKTLHESTLKSDYEKKNFAFNNIVNILNFDDLCEKYEVKYVPKFKQINEQNSVGRYHESHYYAWKNNTIADYEEYLRVHKPPEYIKQRKKQELKIKLKQAEDEHNYIMKHFDELDVRIISYDNAMLYPEIKIYTQRHSNPKHLRSTVANLLWFKPAASRRNKSADIFIQNAKNPYGDVYYIE